MFRSLGPAALAMTDGTAKCQQVKNHVAYSVVLPIDRLAHWDNNRVVKMNLRSHHL